MSEFGTPTIEEDESETINQKSSDVKQSEILVKENSKVEDPLITAEQVLPINDLEPEKALVDNLIEEDKPVSEMILTNEKLNHTETFNKRLDLNDEDLPIKLSDSNTQFEEEQKLYKENIDMLHKSDLIVDTPKMNDNTSSDRNSLNVSL